jgi:penicillin-binding protein 1A
MPYIKTFFKTIFFITFLGCAFLLGALFFVVHNHNIDFSILAHYRPGAASIILDDQGNEWARFQLDKREPIKLENIPQHLIDAFTSAEDWEFFNHPGISWRGIARSTLVNLYHGRKVQGASTITQQLIKLLFFDCKKTFERKIKEQIYAFLVERQCTKEQILETYLNHIYFGCGIYGVQAACERFWGKSVTQITIAQAAMLAGIVRSPGNYCPLISLDLAQKRRNIVLHSMRKRNLITPQQYETAKIESIATKSGEQNLFAAHVKESLRVFLEDLVGKKALYCDGLIIQTTINRAIQTQAEKLFYEQSSQLKKNLNNDIDGALISMDVKSGEIKALIGGYDFNNSKFNRALQAKRQMGSIFKPLIYACALQAGLHFTDTDIDEPFEMMQPNGALWKPNNYNDQFNGRITLAYALSHSNNIVTIKTLLKIGMQPVIDLAKKCHISGPFHNYPSLALGCIDCNLKEVTGMFNVFANAGIYIEPHMIKWIKDQWGKKIWKYNPVKEYVLPSRISGQVAHVLTLALERTRQSMKDSWIESQAISKTGTTNDSRVCWYVGSTPELTTAIYIGCDNNRSLGNRIFPIKTAFPIWLGLNKEFPSKQKKFSYDSSLKEILIHEKTGRLAYDAHHPEIISILA